MWIKAQSLSSTFVDKNAGWAYNTTPGEIEENSVVAKRFYLI